MSFPLKAKSKLLFNHHQGRISCSGHLIVQTGPLRTRLSHFHSQRWEEVICQWRNWSILASYMISPLLTNPLGGHPAYGMLRMSKPRSAFFSLISFRLQETCWLMRENCAGSTVKWESGQGTTENVGIGFHYVFPHIDFTVFLSSRWVVYPSQSWCGWSTGNPSTQTCIIRCWYGRMESTLWSLIHWHRRIPAHTHALLATRRDRAPLAWNWESWVRKRWFLAVSCALPLKPHSFKSLPPQRKRWSILPSSWKSCRTWGFLKELPSGWNAELWVCPLPSSSGRKTMTRYRILKRESRKQTPEAIVIPQSKVFFLWFHFG